MCSTSPLLDLRCRLQLDRVARSRERPPWRYSYLRATLAGPLAPVGSAAVEEMAARQRTSGRPHLALPLDDLWRSSLGQHTPHILTRRNE